MTKSHQKSNGRSTKSLTVFLDSSVVLSGLASPTGGSAKILHAGSLYKLKLIVTPQVIQEVSLHLSKFKLSTKVLQQLITSKTIQVAPNPTTTTTQKFTQLTPDKNDAHILAGTVTSGSDFLISLDKKHILTPKVKKALNPIKVLSPKQFWQQTT